MNHVRLAPTPYQPGSRSGGETITGIAADAVLRPLHDRLILEPLDVVHSKILILANHDRPVRGRVLAVGPGHYPKQYDHREKHKRTKTWDSKVFRATEVKVGDIVELGGSEIGGYAFDGFYWGDRYCICCTERDVAAVVEGSDSCGAAA